MENHGSSCAVTVATQSVEITQIAAKKTDRFIVRTRMFRGFYRHITGRRGPPTKSLLPQGSDNLLPLVAGIVTKIHDLQGW